MEFHENPRYCMHKMVFADRFCVCERCGLTWERGEYGWNVDDPNYVYRKRPQKKPYYKKRR